MIEMKKAFYLLSLALLSAPIAELSAQTGAEGQASTIFDGLEASGSGRGQVIVNQPEAIKNMVGKRMYGAQVERTDTETFLKVQGFRTQVFSGNNQRMSKDEAFRKEKEVKALFPDVPTYVTYNAPFWRLRVGDYRSHEEAYRMMRLLIGAFPSYGKEMYIIREEIKIPLY